jgi:hypothetical protein
MARDVYSGPPTVCTQIDGGLETGQYNDVYIEAGPCEREGEKLTCVTNQLSLIGPISRSWGIEPSADKGK